MISKESRKRRNCQLHTSFQKFREKMYEERRNGKKIVPVVGARAGSKVWDDVAHTDCLIASALCATTADFNRIGTTITTSFLHYVCML